MAYIFPEGTKVFYSNTLAPAKNVTAITNGFPAVATSVAHGFVDLDPILFSSGWEEATDTVFEVDQLTADTFSVLGLDATDTNLYAANTGIGSARKVSNWTEIQQVLNISANGGTPKYGNVSPVGTRMDKKFVIGYESASLELKVGYDPANATQAALTQLARKYTRVAMKLALPGGGRIYGYGILTASEFPEISRGNALQISVGLSMDGRPISYFA